MACTRTYIMYTYYNWRKRTFLSCVLLGSLLSSAALIFHSFLGLLAVHIVQYQSEKEQDIVQYSILYWKRRRWNKMIIHMINMHVIIMKFVLQKIILFLVFCCFIYLRKNSLLSSVIKSIQMNGDETTIISCDGSEDIMAAPAFCND